MGSGLKKDDGLVRERVGEKAREIETARSLSLSLAHYASSGNWWQACSRYPGLFHFRALYPSLTTPPPLTSRRHVGTVQDSFSLARSLPLLLRLLHQLVGGM